jgi:hypothetical protein
MRRPRLLCLLLIVPFFTACPASHDGTLMNELAGGPDFVTESMTVFYSTNLGYHQIDLNGSNRQAILEWGRPGVEHAYTLKEVSADRSLWVYNDSETNLFFQYGPGQELIRIPELDRRLSDVAVHPDNGLVAASRHADYSLPTPQQVDNDRVYLIDVETRQVTVLQDETQRRISRLFWDEAGEYLYLDYIDSDGKVRVDPNTGERVAVGEIPAVHRWRRHQTQCSTTGQRLESDDKGLYLVGESDAREQIVFVEERKRGFHDYFATIDGMHFSDSCNYVVFVFRNGLYVVNVATQLVGKLVEDGVGAIFLLQD